MAKRKPTKAEETPAVEAEPEPAADADREVHPPGPSPSDGDLHQAAAEAYEKLADTAAQLAGQAEEVYASGQATIRSHPGEFLAGSFALGVLVGVLLHRL